MEYDIFRNILRKVFGAIRFHIIKHSSQQMSLPGKLVKVLDAEVIPSQVICFAGSHTR